MPLFRSAPPPPPTPVPSISYERARIMDSYKTTVANTENKVMDHFQVINQQIQRTLEAGLIFNRIVLVFAFILIGVSLYIFIFNPNNNRYQHYFSVLVFVGGIIVIGLLFFRNPVSAFQQYITNYTKLNLVFINYIRQANLLDASIWQVFIESPEETLVATEATLEHFQELVESTLERANQLLDE